MDYQIVPRTHAGRASKRMEAQYSLNKEARLTILSQANSSRNGIGLSKISDTEIDEQRQNFINLYGNEFGQAI